MNMRHDSNNLQHSMMWEFHSPHGADRALAPLCPPCLMAVVICFVLLIKYCVTIASKWRSMSIPSRLVHPHSPASPMRMTRLYTLLASISYAQYGHELDMLQMLANWRNKYACLLLREQGSIATTEGGLIRDVEKLTQLQHCYHHWTDVGLLSTAYHRHPPRQ